MTEKKRFEVGDKVEYSQDPENDYVVEEVIHSCIREVDFVCYRIGNDKSFCDAVPGHMLKEKVSV